MSSNPLCQLHDFGQSVWYDNIHRDMLQSGELARLVKEDGLRGVTSNPTIFEKAIGGSAEYDGALSEAVAEHPEWDDQTLFNHLAVQDIQAAADVLHPVYDASEAHDGYVSIEVSPELANDTQGTIEEARQLHAWVDRPNVMIKVPATLEGLPAIRTLIADGISINVTLLFSVARYRAVAEAYIDGLRDRVAKGLPVNGIASVASFFVSRVDSKVDAQLDGRAEADALAGQIAVANARVAYEVYEKIFNGPDFAELKAAGAQAQRLLWASTGTKNPAYSDVLYVEELIGDNTVTTLPPATYDAYRDHGEPAPRLREGVADAHDRLRQLADAGIDLAAVTEALEHEGVDAFVQSYRSLLNTLAEKRANVATAANMA